MFESLKSLPPRRLLGPPAFLIALGLCAWATFARGLFDGVTLLAGLCGVLSLGLLLLPSRPRLRVEVRNGQGQDLLVIAPMKPVRPLNKEAIVQEQAAIALSGMPERPRPRVAPDATLGEVAGAHIAAGIISSISGASERALQEFEGKVAAYGRNLGQWLTRLEAARAERLRLFEAELRLRELGHAPADYVHLRLHFPAGFQLNSDLLRAGLPPDRPDFSPGISSALINRLNRATELPDIEPIHLPGSEKARYSMEDGAPVIDYDLGRVNQSDRRNVPSFCLRAPAPGSYQVQWEVSAAGLGRPAHGSFTIEVTEPKQGEPITSLSEAEAERDNYNFI
jgi:hypothetical protein